MTRYFHPTLYRLRWLAIVLPTAFALGILALRSAFFGADRGLEGDAFVVVFVTLGATLFSIWIFSIVEEREAEIKRRSDQLTALHSAGIALTTELDLEAVLQKVVELAKGLVGARYAALGVLDAEGEYLQQVVTAGITPEQRAALGAPPRGHGLLGALIHEGKPIRIPEIADDPRSVGFPPNHPPMHSLLGVPIRSKGRIIGDLYMTDKVDSDEPDGAFTAEDQQVLEMFATQAAIAIENAQLYRQKQELAVLRERERFGMDLHDGIIQSIYAVGLMLGEAEHQIETEPRAASRNVRRALNALNDVVRDIRNYILDLRPQRFEGRDLTRGLEELSRAFRANTFLDITVTCDPLEPDLFTAAQTAEILHIAQEALSNIRKHAHATHVDLDLIRDADAVVLEIQDNGIGLDPALLSESVGHGMKNMRERARSLNSTLEIVPGEEGGTRIVLRIPRAGVR